MFKVFAKFSGIDGDSSSTHHPRWIEVLSFQWGVGSGRGQAAFDKAGIRVDVKDVSIVKRIDKASPDLHTKNHKGDEIAEVKVDLVEILPGKQGWYRNRAQYRFEKVSITSIRPGGGGGTDFPLEEVAISYEKATYTAS